MKIKIKKKNENKKNKKNKKNNNEINENKDKGQYNINPLFDFYGGNFKDKIVVFNKEIVIEYSIPFFKENRGSFF